MLTWHASRVEYSGGEGEHSPCADTISIGSRVSRAFACFFRSKLHRSGEELVEVGPGVGVAPYSRRFERSHQPHA